MEDRKVPSWLKLYIDRGGMDKVTAAVRDAELNTVAEIVPMVVRRSSTTGHVSAIVLLFGLLLLFGLVNLGATWLLPFSNLWLTSIGIVVVLFLTWWLPGFHFIERWLTPRADQEEQVLRRAQLEFLTHGIDKTEKRVGVLIYLSMMERQAIVLADDAIVQKLPADTWDRLIAEFIGDLKQKEMALGFEKAITTCSLLLAKDFPIASDDKNEIPNQLIVKE